MIENAGKYLKKKQGAEYARILNVIDVVQSLRSPYKSMKIYRDKRIQKLSNI